MGAAIEADHVGKRYPNGVDALRDLSIAIEPGQVVAVLGPSGSGKTTFFRLCNGTVRPTNGELTVLGEGITHVQGDRLRRLRQRVAVVHQHHNLVLSLSVLQNVLIGRLGRVRLVSAVKSAVAPSAEDRVEVIEILRSLGIEDKLESRADDLSGGQQQRVAVARALMQRPEILLADEPVASVDGETATVILDLLVDVAHGRRTTVLISLHQREYVERYADRVVELSSGRLVRDEAQSRAAAPPRVEAAVG